MEQAFYAILGCLGFFIVVCIIGIIYMYYYNKKEHLEKDSEQNIAVDHFDRITQDLSVMGGKPCIRGMRVTVGSILFQIGEGKTIDELLIDYPYLVREDIMQCLQYGAWLAQGNQKALA